MFDAVQDALLGPRLGSGGTPSTGVPSSDGVASGTEQSVKDALDRLPVQTGVPLTAQDVVRLEAQAREGHAEANRRLGITPPSTTGAPTPPLEDTRPWYVRWGLYDPSTPGGGLLGGLGGTLSTVATIAAVVLALFFLRG